MCGITGFIDHHHLLTEADLKLASATMDHRGGDGSGLIFEKKEHYTLGLANERLATIDLSKNAQQPLSSSCGNYSITFNGTIYNYLELRETLIKYGVIFATLTDTEVILAAYKKWGTQSFAKLDGSFAFALLDRKANQLLLVKDELGSKPLFYYKSKGIYAFASEIRALLVMPGIEKAINKNALASYFRYGYFEGEETIYQQIFKFKKGTVTTIALHSGNSFDMPFILRKEQAIAEFQNEKKILTSIEDQLTESILKRNAADVPIGVLLNGGYDSATVAAVLQKNQSKRIKTYTIGFKDQEIDQAPQAKRIAEHLKTNHQEFYLGDKEVLEIVEQLPMVFDEPIGDSSAIPLVFIAQKINKEVKVLLGAEGGDELFGGYRTYEKALKWNSIQNRKIPQFVKTAWIKLRTAIQPRMKAILAAEGLLNKYLEVNACFTIDEIDRLLTDKPQFEPPIKSNATTIKGLLIHDLHHYLPNNLLIKSDRSFTHYGIDHRDALLNMELTEYLTTLDAKWFIKDGQQKYLLKKITNQYIPANLMKKPKKGFDVPLSDWLKTTLRPLVEQYLSEAQLNQHQLFKLDEVMQLKAKFSKQSNMYHAQKIWLLLQFQMWYNKWMVN